MSLPRWLWFAPVGVLILIFAVNGARLGMQRASLDESAVIDFYAAQYLSDYAELGGSAEPSLTDCAAAPVNDPGIWLVVRCQPSGDEPSWDYYVRSDGALAFTGRERAAEPET